MFWAFTALFTLLAASFALSNRGTVSLELWPLPGTVDAPLYVIVLALLVLGYLIGRLMAWWSYGALRSAHRRRGRDLARLSEAAEGRPPPGRQIQPT